MLRGWFRDLLSVLTMTVLVLSLAAQGLIPVGLAAGALLGLVALWAIGRGTGGGIGHMVRKTLGIALPLTSLAVLLVVHSQGDPTAMKSLLASIGALVLALFGVYVMFRGFTRK